MNGPFQSPKKPWGDDVIEPTGDMYDKMCGFLRMLNLVVDALEEAKKAKDPKHLRQVIVDAHENAEALHDAMSDEMDFLWMNRGES